MAAKAPVHLDLRILVVEDTLMLAEMLVDQLEECGCTVVGPAGHLNRGVALAQTEKLDGALLDVNLNGERCFPIAEVLAARSIPFAFLTGYGDAAIEPKFRHVPRLAKPYSAAELERLLETRFAAVAAGRG
ncbi:MAG TPA: response regulator [Rhodopila sp.]|nr:response regulator [Rhodopila sp.]